MERLEKLDHQANMTVLDQAYRAMANRCLAAPGLCIGSSAPTAVKIANTVHYLVGGIFKSKTTAEVAFTATTHDIAADADTARAAWYLLSLDADGTPTLTMGEIADASEAALPELPTTGTVIGAVKVAVAAGSTKFDATSDNLSATHITDTYVDFGFLHPLFGAEATCTGYSVFA